MAKKIAKKMAGAPHGAPVPLQVTCKPLSGVDYKVSYLVENHVVDAWRGSAPKGALPGLGKRQCSIEYVVFRCPSFLSIFVDRNGGLL